MRGFTTRPFRIGWAALAALSLVPILDGCGSEPQAPPVASRPAGSDLSPEARADKRGDNPTNLKPGTK